MRVNRRSNSSLFKEVDWQARCLEAEAALAECQRQLQEREDTLTSLRSQLDHLKATQVLSQFEGSLDLSQSHVLDLASTVPGSTPLNPSGMLTTLKNSGMFRPNTKALARISSLGSEESAPEDHMFEEFFILGLTTPDTKECKPQVLYQYPKLDYIQDSVQYKVIPDFCFPMGCTPYPLQLTSSGSALNEILYGREGLTRSGNFYIFTLKSDPKVTTTPSSEPNYDQSVIYCVCLLTDELLITSDGQWIYPKCYCLASFQPCFELHYKVLTSLLAQKRLRRMSVVAGSSLSSSSLGRIMSPSEDISDNEIAILCDYHQIVPPSANSVLRLSLDSPLEYRYFDPCLMDVTWCCPSLLTSLPVPDLLTVLTAVMLEKSVVFISNNKGLLTSCV